MSYPQSAPAFSKSALRLASQLARPSRQRCPQCLRTFSSSRPFQTSSKRKLQTASALRPQSFEPPPPPPRGNFNFSTPLTKDTGTNADAATIVSNKAPSIFDSIQPTEQSPVAQKAQTSEQSPSAASTEKKKPIRHFKFAPRKATIKLSPTAVDHIRQLLDQPEPKLLRIGTKNKGCSGLAYNLEYVDKPGKFDETVEQDGVKVLIESRTLLHIIGSEMDWVEDKLSARFVFKNPNITESCGCGESFSIS